MIALPKITVYIPAYNYAKYVEKAIESVLNQTFKTWELLVINDGSTDETESILKKYELCDKVAIVNQKNKGLTVTCNIALRLAKGEYFMRLDGDDYLDENALLVMAHFLEEHPEIGFVYPDYYLVDENDEVLSIERMEKVIGEGNMLLDKPAHGACTMFRRHVLTDMGGYDEKITCQDGYDIWLRIIEKYKVGNINLPLFYYRQHGNNMTKNNRKILETRQKIKRKHAELKKIASNAREIKRVAIIPARSYSDVMNRLALQECAGQPLINYTLNEAVKANCFNRIVVVSEDDDIMRFVKENYPYVITVKRSPEYARRNTGLEKTVAQVLDTMRDDLGEEYEEVMLLFVESPLKRSEHIIKAVDTMSIFDVDSVISLCETYSPYYVRGKNGLERIGSKEQFKLERKIMYRGNGALFLLKVKNLTQNNLAGEKIGHIIMHREDSINIITPFEYKIADFLLNNSYPAE